jgi:hypothetical protein
MKKTRGKISRDTVPLREHNLLTPRIAITIIDGLGPQGTGSLKYSLSPKIIKISNPNSLTRKKTSYLFINRTLVGSVANVLKRS